MKLKSTIKHKSSKHKFIRKTKKGIKYARHHLVPCDMNDYERAMKNEIPDLWWKTYQKLG